MWKQATPGELIVGLRVRLRDRPGPMPLPTVAAALGGPVRPGRPRLASCRSSAPSAAIYTLLDDLWPLWDDKNQALHDKIAKTNVVRLR